MKKFKLEELDLTDIKENPEPDLTTDIQNTTEENESNSQQKENQIDDLNLNEIENENSINSNKKKNENENKKIKSKNLFQNKIAYIILALTVGLSTFSTLAISYFLKDNLNASPTQSSIINSILNIPSIIQPFFGLLSDFFPLCGYRRKYYIIICGFLQTFCWLIIKYSSFSLTFATFLLFICNCCVSFCIILTDSIVIQLSNYSKKKINKYGAYIIVKNIGMFISAFLRGIVIQYFKINTIFIFAAILSSFNIIGGIIYIEIFDEDKKSNEIYKKVKVKNNYDSLPQNENNTIGNNENINIKNTNNNDNDIENIDNNKVSFYNLLIFIFQKKVLIPLFYLLFLASTPSFFDSAFYYLDSQNYTKKDFGQMTLIIMFLIVIISFSYKKYFKNLKTKKLITLSIILSFLGSTTCYLCIKNNYLKRTFIFGGIGIYVSLKQLGIMPLMGLAFVISPKNYEGSVYSIFSSSANLGKALSILFGSFMNLFFNITQYNFKNFTNMIWYHNLLVLIPLFPLFFIDDKLLSHEKEEKVIEIKVDLGERKKLKKNISDNYNNIN